MDLKEGRSKRNGLIYDEDRTITRLYDPWRNPYHIILDTKGDGVLMTKRGP